MSVFDNAKYIKADAAARSFSQHDPLPFFRREFTVCKKSVNEAELFIQAPGFAEVFINGAPITLDKFISPISDYSRILWYNRYDVGELLCDGVNTIAVIAGNGFFNESFTTGWKFHLAKWRDAPQFILSLRINGEEILVSDSEFKVSRAHSHIIFSHLRSGEYVDMRKYDEGWMTSGYDDSTWRAAIERDSSEVTGEFKLTECQPVRECEVLGPTAITKVNDGWLVDFGKNSSGYIEITLKAHRGQEITFHYCEEVHPDGTPKHNHMDDIRVFREDGYRFQVNKLIASGGEDTFKPRFSYHGFRYVLIEGLDDRPDENKIRAYFIHNDVKRTADFNCGDNIINFIYNAGIRSSLSNMFWSVTDCPTREKLGWTNDAQASTEQMLINFDIVPLYKKWFEDLLADQTESGEIHGIIPTPGWGLGWGPVCDFFLFELPWRIYLYTADKSMLSAALPHFEKYAAFLKRAIDENHEFMLGDWLGGGGGSAKVIPNSFVRDAYMVKVLSTIAKTRRILELEACAAFDAESAFRERFMAEYLTEDGRCTIDEQTSCAMMLMLGLYRDKKTLGRQLATAVERDGAQLKSGMVGVQYLYDALSEAERPDLAYRILTESDPGYKTWYDNGATTLWERWDGVDLHSHNHHMYSNVIAWFFKSLLGIAPDEDAPAFERVIVSPKFVEQIGFVKGYEDTVRGRIEAEWRYEDGGFVYEITLPEGISGEYMGTKLATGKNTFYIKESDI